MGSALDMVMFGQDHQQIELHGDKKYILKPLAREKKDNFYQSMYLPRVEL